MDFPWRSDPKAIRTCILYKVCEKKPIYQSYDELSKTIGENFMGFQQFEHYYRRFEKGQCDLDYDGRPEFNRELIDMPTELFHKILSCFTLQEKWLLKTVSRRFQYLIDPKLPGCECLSIIIVNGKRELWIDTFCKDHVVQDYSHMPANRKFMIAMLEDVRLLMRHPRTELKNLNIVVDFEQTELGESEKEYFFQQLQPLLQHVSSYLRTILIAASDLTLRILNELTPGVVQQIMLLCFHTNVNEIPDFEKLYDMEQWKQATILQVLEREMLIPFDKVMHFTRFTGRYQSMEPETLVGVVNKMQQSGTLISCKIHLDPLYFFDFREANKRFGPLNPEFDESIYHRRFSIPHSSDIIELKVLFEENAIALTRLETRNDSDESAEEDDEDGQNDDENNMLQ